MDELKIEFLGPHALHLGEAPFWDQKSNSLFLIDTFIGDVIRLNLMTGETITYNLRDYISIVIPIADKENSFIISRRNTLIEFNWATKVERIIASVGLEKFNDGKVDVKGRLWIGTLRNIIKESNEGSIKNGGALYRLDGHNLNKIETMSLPNGMDWSPDNRKFYIADTQERQIYSYDFDVTSGSISHKQVFLEFNNNPNFEAVELPDGMAVDKFGHIWVAIIFGGRIIQLDSETGKILRSIQTMANQTTSIAWGGSDFSEMYVTTGNRNLSESEKKDQPNVGKTLKIIAPFIHGRGPTNRCIL